MAVYNELNKSTEFFLGETVWYVPLTQKIAIKSKIVEIDDYFWIDEPVTHGLRDDELFVSKEEANDALLATEGNSVELSEYRRSTIKFIVSTWEGILYKKKEVDLWLQQLPKKVKNVDWFNTPRKEVV